MGRGKGGGEGGGSGKEQRTLRTTLLHIPETSTERSRWRRECGSEAEHARIGGNEKKRFGHKAKFLEVGCAVQMTPGARPPVPQSIEPAKTALPCFRHGTGAWFMLETSRNGNL